MQLSAEEHWQSEEIPQSLSLPDSCADTGGITNGLLLLAVDKFTRVSGAQAPSHPEPSGAAYNANTQERSHYPCPSKTALAPCPLKDSLPNPGAYIQVPLWTHAGLHLGYAFPLRSGPTATIIR